MEVDSFQARVPVDNRVFGFDVPVSDIELVKIRDALGEAGEAPTYLSGLPTELVQARET
jgi:hypothetical protein